MINSYEIEYCNSIKEILKYGVMESNRTGIDTLAVQHRSFTLKDITNNFPIINGKKTYPKLALKEICWFLMGRTDVQWLRDHKVTYWDEWERADGTIGKSYGHQWRNFNGFDQLETLVRDMISNPSSRRHIVTLWNPNDLADMVLPPCLYDYHFCCVPDIEEPIYYVDLHTTMRSNDSFLGLPYNFIGSAWLSVIICDMINKSGLTEKFYVPRNIYHTSHDYHLYTNHYNQALEYIRRVEENKEDCLSRKYKLMKFNVEPPFCEDINGLKKYVDEYLKNLELIISTNDICLEKYNTETDFEYGKISADVAV